MSARISLRGMLRLSRFYTLRRVHNVEFLVERLIYSIRIIYTRMGTVKKSRVYMGLKKYNNPQWTSWKRRWLKLKVIFIDPILPVWPCMALL